MPHRLLFASIHSYLDPSSGAALATRELLELLAARGWDCRALTCGVLDYQNETPLEDVLASIERPTSRVGAALSRGGEAEVFDLELDGVRLTLLPTAYSRAERAPSAREAGLFLDLADQVLDRFRPEVLLTYGGHPVSRELMHRARAKGTAVVFHLHNFGYNDRRGLEDVDAFIFPSIFATSLRAVDRRRIPPIHWQDHRRRSVVSGPSHERRGRSPTRSGSYNGSLTPTGTREPGICDVHQSPARKGCRRLRADCARIGPAAAGYPDSGCRGARDVGCTGRVAGRPVGPDEPEPDGQYARPA